MTSPDAKHGGAVGPLARLARGLTAIAALALVTLIAAPGAASAAGGADVDPFVYRFMVFVIAIFVGLWVLATGLNLPVLRLAAIPSTIRETAVIAASALSLVPPTSRTRPSGSSVAVWCRRADSGGAVACHIPVAGSKISALCIPVTAPALGSPPATSTRPSASSVAVCAQRPLVSDPVAVHVGVVGP